MAEIIVENLSSQIEVGMDVYDSRGDKVGMVQQLDLTGGWFQTEKGVFFSQDRYIPVSAIDYLGPAGIYLSVTREDVKDLYDKPPTVEVDVVAGSAGTAAVGTVTSGYDGSRVVVNSETISQVLQRLANGLVVYDANGGKVGRVFQYDPGNGWIMVEKGLFSSKNLFIPVTAIDYLDGDGVHLRVTKDVLLQTFVVKPPNATFIAVEE